MGAAQPALSSLISTSNSKFDNQQLADKITLLAGHINAANYRLLKLIAEFDNREAWADDGIRSCAHWLNWKCGIALGAAREKIRVAHSLEALPKTNEAFQQGFISYSKVRAISRVATNDNEDFLLDIAKQGTASHMELLVRKYQGVKRQIKRTELVKQVDIDRDTKDPEQFQEDAREMLSYQDSDGMWIIHAKMPAETGALIVKAIEAIVNEQYKEANQSNENVSAETLLAKESISQSIENKPPSIAKRRADALSTMAEHFLASKCNINGIKTLAGNERCQIMLHVDLKTLQSQNGCSSNNNFHANHHCNSDNRHWLSPETAKRLACDASIVTVLEDSHAKVLNIGRRSRTIPPSILRALNLRDTTCQFPGCCSSKHLDAHHIIHWANGGETRLDNLIMLCRHHHTKLHQENFTLEMTSSGPLFISAKGKHLNCSVFPQFAIDEKSAQKVEPSFEKQFPLIDESTAVSHWHGEQLDYDIAINSML